MNVKKIVCLPFIGVLLSFTSQLFAANQIQQIRSNSMDEKVQIVIDVAEKPDLNAFSLSSPTRLVVDIQGSPASDFHNKLSFRNRGVSIVRTGTPDKNKVRVVLELAKDFRWKTYAVPPNGAHGHRVVVDVFDYPSKAPNNRVVAKRVNAPAITLESHKAGIPNVAKQYKAAPKVAKQFKAVPKKKRALAKVRIVHRPVAKAKTKIQPKVKARAIKTAARKPHRYKDILVMIDPGHGGKDSGAIGLHHTQEKRVVLQIAKRLKRKIDAIPGMRAVLTRRSDRYITLRGRLALARKYKPDLFVSIHADAVHRRAARGSSVFILSNRGASSEAAKILAQGQNAVDRKYGIATSSSYDNEVGNVLLKMQQDATIESSHSLAKKTLRQLKGIGSVHKRFVERAGFAVLKSPNIPSMLVETAFISNPEEEQKLRNSNYQDRLASAIARGIKSYFNTHMAYQSRTIKL